MHVDADGGRDYTTITEWFSLQASFSEKALFLEVCCSANVQINNVKIFSVEASNHLRQCLEASKYLPYSSPESPTFWIVLLRVSRLLSRAVTRALGEDTNSSGECCLEVQIFRHRFTADPPGVRQHFPRELLYVS